MSWLRKAMCGALLCVSCGDATVSSNTAAVTLRADVAPVERVEDAMPGVFIPPFEDCRDGVCTNVAISGCTEAGRYFPDVASCAVVRTQRPFWPEAPAAEPRADDPRLNDPAFMQE